MKTISRIFSYLLLLAACVVSEKASAQVSVQANMDSIEILIGEQAHMFVEVTAKKGAAISWPELKPNTYLVPGVEIVDITNADTSALDNDMVKVVR